MAKAVLAELHVPPSASPEERAIAAQQAQEAIEEISSRLAFGQTPAQRRTKNMRLPKVGAVYFRNLLIPGAEDDSDGLLPADQPVQLAMFAM